MYVIINYNEILFYIKNKEYIENFLCFFSTPFMSSPPAGEAGQATRDPPQGGPSSKKKSKNYKYSYNLDSYVDQALIGLMLGDGYLERSHPNHNTRLRLEQAYPEKELYFNHLYHLFEPLVSMSPTVLERKPDKRTGIKYSSIYF